MHVCICVVYVFAHWYMCFLCSLCVLLRSVCQLFSSIVLQHRLWDRLSLNLILVTQLDSGKKALGILISSFPTLEWQVCATMLIIFMRRLRILFLMFVLQIIYQLCHITNPMSNQPVWMLWVVTGITDHYNYYCKVSIYSCILLTYNISDSLLFLLCYLCSKMCSKMDYISFSLEHNVTSSILCSADWTVINALRLYSLWTGYFLH